MNCNLLRKQFTAGNLLPSLRNITFTHVRCNFLHCRIRELFAKSYLQSSFPYSSVCGEKNRVSKLHSFFQTLDSDGMSTSTSSNSTLLTIQQQLLRYVYPIWLIFGITGCLLSIVVFMRPQLRTTSCCICESIYCCPALSSPFPLRLIHRSPRCFHRSSCHSRRRHLSCPLHARSSRSSSAVPLVLQGSRLSLPDLSDAVALVRRLRLPRSMCTQLRSSSLPQLGYMSQRISWDCRYHCILVGGVQSSTSVLRDQRQSLCSGEQRWSSHVSQCCM